MSAMTAPAPRVTAALYRSWRHDMAAGPRLSGAVLAAGPPHDAAQPEHPDEDQGDQGHPEQEMQRGDHHRDDHEEGEHREQDQDQTSHGPTICHRGHRLARQGHGRAGPSGVPPAVRCAAATRLGTTMRQASRTSSVISSRPMAPSLTSTQLYRRSDWPGSRNLPGSEATSASRSSLGKANPMTVSSAEK